ncbi:Complement receptor type 1 [Frankliniella fusca]|uniref:Complement receptor type 1 n=1 Tax=Frankliniella fusca TaxID=407009 RepID=A0AAE1LAT2_9NEOP|nr:Complement receptor type 1 [Frankliniella fusca]KAK3932940.1 Complement receptor type 1 [Frankliniella fusca]
MLVHDARGLASFILPSPGLVTVVVTSTESVCHYAFSPHTEQTARQPTHRKEAEKDRGKMLGQNESSVMRCELIGDNYYLSPISYSDMSSANAGVDILQEQPQENSAQTTPSIVPHTDSALAQAPRRTRGRPPGKQPSYHPDVTQPHPSSETPRRCKTASRKPKSAIARKLFADSSEPSLHCRSHCDSDNKENIPLREIMIPQKCVSVDKVIACLELLQCPHCSVQY